MVNTAFFTLFNIMFSLKFISLHTDEEVKIFAQWLFLLKLSESERSKGVRNRFPSISSNFALDLHGSQKA